MPCRCTHWKKRKNILEIALKLLEVFINKSKKIRILFNKKNSLLVLVKNRQSYSTKQAVSSIQNTSPFFVFFSSATATSKLVVVSAVVVLKCSPSICVSISAYTQLISTSVFELFVEDTGLKLFKILVAKLLKIEQHSE